LAVETEDLDHDGGDLGLKVGAKKIRRRRQMQT
jgi:hypothetical protein